jgi:Ca-activated chloride channel family protein
LGILAIAGMGVALARPQWGTQPETARSLGDDVLFLLDCSRSMLASDLRPNRLTRSKLAIMDFVRQQSLGRVGLVAFAGDAFLQCPLTFDYDAFNEALIAVDDQTIPVLGTDLGRALDEGFLAMEKNDRRKIMVLLTDGEDLEKSGVDTARKLGDQGVVIFSVGVGTRPGSPIQMTNALGVAEWLRDTQGRVVQSRLDEEVLSAIAQATRGAYQPLGAVGEGMRQIRRQLENTPDFLHYRPRRQLGIDRFHVFLVFVVVLLVVESLISTRKKSPAHGLVLACLLSCWPYHGVTFAQTPPSPASALHLYNQGSQLLEEGKLREAEQILTEALLIQDVSCQPAALYNLGHVRYRLGAEALRQGPMPESLPQLEAARTALAQKAIDDAETALARQRIEAIVDAYRQARLARRQLKPVADAVKTALESHRNALMRWERASSDFKSAIELNPTEADARFNADVMDRHIARLVELVQQLQQSMQSLAGQRQRLQQQIEAMKKFLPKELHEDGGDEEDEDSETPLPKPGDQEKPGREGKERMMTREEAARLLNSLRLDANRKLPMGMHQTGASDNRQGKTW